LKYMQHAKTVGLILKKHPTLAKQTLDYVSREAHTNNLDISDVMKKVDEATPYGKRTPPLAITDTAHAAPEAPIPRRLMIANAPAAGASECEVSPPPAEAANMDHMSAMQDDRDQWLATCYSRLNTFSPLLLERICLVCDPVTLNKKNLQNLKTLKQRTVTRDKFNEVIDFATGLPPDWSATGEHRHLKSLFEHMTDRTLERNQRTRNLQLGSLDWSKQGIHEIVQAGPKKVVLGQRFTKEKRELAAHQLAMIKEVKKLRIVDNQSETKAMLCEEHPKGISIFLSTLSFDHCLKVNDLCPCEPNSPSSNPIAQIPTVKATCCHFHESYMLHPSLLDFSGPRPPQGANNGTLSCTCTQTHTCC
jgi:hypothetical protein